ncbi:MAG: ABC transporter substrate-binding protein, partial [Lachnospiraceae bacterium]|nr:ABC transporter substrate-binding protein [Lachnospiraceae bacterium]
MKLSKKIMCLALTGVMTVAMCSCGNNTNTTTDTTNTTDTETQATEGTFKIGGIGPVTGGAAIYGQNVKNAIELAVNEINENGGVNGANLELNFQDDEHDAEKAVNAYNSIKDWGAQILIGTVTSTPCIAVTDKTKEDNMFQISPSGSAVKCTQYDNCFRVCFSDPSQGSASAEYIAKNGLASKVAVIYNSSDVYSSGIYENFAAGAEGIDAFEIVAAEAFTEDSKTDFTVQLQKAKDAGADLVFLPIYYNEAALILTQAAKMDYAPKFFSCDGMDGILSCEGFDTSY